MSNTQEEEFQNENMAAASVKTNRPPGDKFRQQKLDAWQPIMTPWKVIILFTAIGISFIPTGVTLWSASNKVTVRTRHFRQSDELNLNVDFLLLNYLCDNRYMNQLSHTMVMEQILIVALTATTKGEYAM